MLMHQLLFMPGKSNGWQGAVAALALVLMTPAAATTPERVATQVENAARQHLHQQAERAGWLEPRYTLTVVTSDKAPSPCRGEVDIEATDTRYASRMRFTADCPGQWRRGYVVRAEVSAQVVVAAASVPAGRPLAPADLTLERRSITATADATSQPEPLVGLSSKRALRQGEIVRTGLLLAPLLVQRGASVRIVARREQVEVTMAGVALEAGARGALIRVRNSGTGKVIRARVTEPGTVEPAEM
jgi:flagellar basal body P-ring formation protein FlgA